MNGFRSTVLVVALGLVCVPPVSASGVEASSSVEDPGMYAELVAMLEREVATRLTRHLQDQGKLRQVTVGIVIEPRKRRMVINFGPGYLPGKKDSYGELFLEPLAADLRRYSERSGMEFLDVEFLFQGKSMDEHFPEDHPPSAMTESRSAHSKALMSSSHGYIALHPGGEWEFQRPSPLGLQEDVLSPIYGDALEDLLEQRSGLVVYRARSRSVEPHPEAIHPWEHMSARYHLKALFPDRADIWNEFPNSPDSDREVKEDIRARPNYANHLGVDVMLSLHTNGSIDPGVRGAEVYYHQSKPQDKALGDSILCGMREIIQSQPGYENFPVREMATSGRHGENRIGTMPSIIVETAYHSNPDDVAALQDPVFRAASMKGVEKGYRLWAEGKACAPLTGHPVADIDVPAGSSREVDVTFDGHPQFPIRLVTKNTVCPPGWTCTGTTVIVDTPDQPSRVKLSCGRNSIGTLGWETHVLDTDGVQSKPMPYTVRCVPGSGRERNGLPENVAMASS